MVNRSVNELDDFWKQLRALVSEYDVTIITAQAPRQRPSFVPQTEHGVIIIDYPSQLGNKSCNRQP